MKYYEIIAPSDTTKLRDGFIGTSDTSDAPVNLIAAENDTEMLQIFQNILDMYQNGFTFPYHNDKVYDIHEYTINEITTNTSIDIGDCEYYGKQFETPNAQLNMYIVLAEYKPNGIYHIIITDDENNEELKSYQECYKVIKITKSCAIALDDYHYEIFEMNK